MTVHVAIAPSYIPLIVNSHLSDYNLTSPHVFLSTPEEASSFVSDTHLALTSTRGNSTSYHIMLILYNVVRQLEP